MKYESQDLIKEINGLIGAVDGDTLKHLRRFIRKYNTLYWKYNRLKERVQRLLDEIDNEIKEAELEKKGKGYYRFFDNVMTLKRVKSLVKKWLVDETEEER